MVDCLQRCWTAFVLRRRTYENTHAYVPRILTGKVVRVYDGDTFHLAFRVSCCRTRRIRVRLAGVDCAELRSSDQDEKFVAKCAKRILEELVLGRVVTLHQPLLWDKYGRRLADLAVTGVPSVSDWMIGHAAGVSYTGGTKPHVDWSAVRRKMAASPAASSVRIH